jgi:phospholipase C
MRTPARNFLAAAAAAALLPATMAAAVSPAQKASVSTPRTATPIRHLVVLFQENVSFDHYFGTYPHAANTDGRPFHAKRGTPRVNGLTGALLTHNPNEYNPERLTPAQALTCDQDHGYTAEQQAFDGGLMDKFVQYTGNSDCRAPAAHPQGLVMDYFDGNTVTALWHYAQRFAMSDNFHGTEFGQSTAGALNLVSGELYGANGMSPAGRPVRTNPGVVGSPNALGIGTMYSDQDPFYDGCSDRSTTMLRMNGPNIGNLLNAKHVTWGWFEGGFAPTSRTRSGSPVCARAHDNIGGQSVPDYIPHHEPFQYYRSTANPEHLPPASLAEVGRPGRANHQYDISWFFRALHSRNLPAVSFLKAPGYADGHAGYSDPLDEQHYLVDTINAIERSRYWRSTAIMLTYDDSDGWYDHAMPPIVNPSADLATDALNGTGICGHGTPLAGHQDRCGYGPRLPLLLISPYARRNAVDGSLTDQTSVLRFIEDNWLGGERIGHGSFDTLAGSLNGLFDWTVPQFAPLILNPETGEPRR